MSSFYEGRSPAKGVDRSNHQFPLNLPFFILRMFYQWCALSVLGEVGMGGRRVSNAHTHTHTTERYTDSRLYRDLYNSLKFFSYFYLKLLSRQGGVTFLLTICAYNRMEPRCYLHTVPCVHMCASSCVQLTTTHVLTLRSSEK